VRLSEWVAFLYFAYLFAVAVLKGPWPRRRPAVVLSALCALLVAAVALAPDVGWMSIARDWLPAAYLVAGYWLSGLYFVSPMVSIEQYCAALDRRLLESLRVDAFIARAPRLLIEVLELAYFACFLFVPACVALVLLTRHPLGDRSWAMVLLAEFGAFGMLPWVQTRPPRTIETPGALDQRPLMMKKVNRFMVRRTSIQVNTLPSGHVAGSLAAAFAVSAALPRAGLAAFFAAAAITVSAVVGRYHYAVDAVTGVGVALVAWALISALA
jgi:hypothetical protein